MYTLHKQKDMFISLDLYLQHEGPFMHQFMMFYNTLEFKEQKFWSEAVNYMQAGATFEESIEHIKQNVDNRIYPFLLLLGSHKKPHEITKMIIERLEHMISMRRMKEKVLKYPKFLFMLLIMCMLAYLFIMIPMYETMFSRYTFEAHSLMYQMIQISQYLREHPLFIVIFMSLIVFSYKGMMYIIPKSFPKLKYQVIFFKKISLTALYMDFTYMLSTFLKSHMTLKEALEQTLKISPSFLEKGILNGISHIEEGKPFTESFIDLPSYPKDMEKLIMHAQEDTQLILVLTLLSKRYHMSYESQREKYIQALTPLLMMIIGSLILVMFYMIYAPILNMYEVLEYS
jgi:type II secretory pathway component PulF